MSKLVQAHHARHAVSLSGASDDRRWLLREASSARHYDLFLSHGYEDATEVRSIKEHIEITHNLRVYVDWIDETDIDRRAVTAATAARLRERIRRCRGLLIAASDATDVSRWVPWELGYADGSHGRVAVLPVLRAGSTFVGNEYMRLYPEVMESLNTRHEGPYLWVGPAPAYRSLADWLT